MLEATKKERTSNVGLLEFVWWSLKVGLLEFVWWSVRQSPKDFDLSAELTCLVYLLECNLSIIVICNIWLCGQNCSYPEQNWTSLSWTKETLQSILRWGCFELHKSFHRMEIFSLIKWPRHPNNIQVDHTQCWASNKPWNYDEEHLCTCILLYHNTWHCKPTPM